MRWKEGREEMKERGGSEGEIRRGHDGARKIRWEGGNDEGGGGGGEEVIE